VTDKRNLMAAACLLALPLTAGAEPAAPVAPAGVTLDARSERVLLDACAFLRSAPRFSVEAEITYDDVLKTGRKVQYSREAAVLLERPNRLRAALVSDKGERTIYYDGKTMTVYRPDRAVYAVLDAPASVDATLDAIEQRGVEMPLDDFLRAQPCGGLAARLKTGTYAGKHYFDGGWYHHLLLETDAADAQLWVADGDVPEIRKLVISYRDAPGTPQYTAVLRNWNFAPVIEGGTFTFSPPQGVKKIAYREPAGSQGGGK
jgi:hypothetical protein